MTKLMDIKGYWDMSYGDNFNDRDMWEGQILLEDDGWFEGVVVDPNSSYTEDRFVFGVYYPEKVMELFKFTPIKINSPFVFHGKRDAKGYYGKFEAIGFFGPTPCGNCHMITQYAEVDRGNVDEEVRTLEAKIQRYKSHIMDKAGRVFYEDTIAIRKELAESILKNHGGKGVTSEEEGKKLAKQMPKDLPSEDEGLPF